MKRLAETSSVFEAEELHRFLESRGVESFVFGAETFSTPGINPLAFPSVWIAEDDELERAQALLRRFRADRNTIPPGPAWTCACGERHEGQFDVCWRCGAIRRD